MSTSISDLHTLVASMSPTLDRRPVAFVTLPEGSTAAASVPQAAIIGTFREREGLTLIVELGAAQAAGLPIVFEAAWISLTVHSDLHAVGLTAAFAGALGAAGISCNVVAAAYHDHIFVPLEAAGRAMAALQKLQQDAAASSPR